jgi:hypothetical protein
MPIHARKLPADAHERIGTTLAPDKRSIPPSLPESAPAPRIHDSPPQAGDAPYARQRSEATPPHDDGAGLPWYRKESWLAVQLAALIPILGAMFVPAPYRLAMCVVGGALIAIGTVMMLRDHARTPSRTFEDVESS